jgi:hypothetical protein
LMDMISPRAFLLTNGKNVWYGLSTSLWACGHSVKEFVHMFKTWFLKPEVETKC